MAVFFLPIMPKLLKTFPNEAISSLITRNALIFVIDFFINIFDTTKPKCHFFSAGLTALSAQPRVNQNKQNCQTFGEKVKLTKIFN